MPNVMLKLPESTYKQLKDISESECRTLPNLIRFVLAGYLKSNGFVSPSSDTRVAPISTKPVEVKVASVRKPAYNDVHPDNPDEDIDGIDFDED